MKMCKVMYPIEDMTWKESLKYVINKKLSGLDLMEICPNSLKGTVGLTSLVWQTLKLERDNKFID